MDFERQITALLLLGLAALTGLFTHVMLWPHRAIPGVAQWILGIWLAALGFLLIAVPTQGWEALSILVRNEALIWGTACITLGTAQMLGRRLAMGWIYVSAICAVPFLMHWIPGIPDFAGRAGIVSVATFAWLFGAAWLWAQHGRRQFGGTALFAAMIFAIQAAFHVFRSCYLFAIARPSRLEEVGFMQSVTFAESALYLVVLGITLWMLTNLRAKTPASSEVSQ
jgi:hypothetical protein